MNGINGRSTAVDRPCSRSCKSLNRPRTITKTRLLGLMSDQWNSAVDLHNRSALARARVCRPQMTRRTAPTPTIDWFQVIMEISRYGFSMQVIAQSIGVARTTLLGWKQGAEPRHSEGDRLLTFWTNVTGHDRSEAPMVSISDWWAYHAK